jgi:hypothetical protein
VNTVRPSRFVVLAALLAAWFGSNVAGAPAARATVHPSDGDDPGPQLSTLKTVLIFGLIPVGAMLLIALVVSLPSLVRGPRYRPGRNWQGTPEWYGAPAAEVDAGPGHASGDAVTGKIVATGDSDGGGSSARW